MDPKGGIMNWWYGNPNKNKHGGGGHRGDLAKSDLIEEEVKDEDNVGHKVNRYSQNQMKASNKRGLSQDFNSYNRTSSRGDLDMMGNSSHYDRSNLPPIILPQVPHRMRASAQQENSRVIMETIII